MTTTKSMSLEVRRRRRRRQDKQHKALLGTIVEASESAGGALVSHVWICDESPPTTATKSAKPMIRFLSKFVGAFSGKSSELVHEHGNDEAADLFIGKQRDNSAKCSTSETVIQLASDADPITAPVQTKQIVPKCIKIEMSGSQEADITYQNQNESSKDTPLALNNKFFAFDKLQSFVGQRIESVVNASPSNSITGGQDHSAPEKPQRQLYGPLAAGHIEAEQFYSMSPMTAARPSKPMTIYQLAKREVEAERLQRDCQSTADDSKVTPGSWTLPRRHFQAGARVDLSSNRPASTWSKEVIRPLPRVSKSLPRSAPRAAHAIAPSFDRDRCGTIQKCVISLKSPTVPQTSRHTVNHRSESEAYGHRQLNHFSSVRSEIVPKASKTGSISSESSSGCVSGASFQSLERERLDAMPTTFYRRRRQALQQMRRQRQQQSHDRHNDHEDDGERDREITVMAFSFCQPECLQDQLSGSGCDNDLMTDSAGNELIISDSVGVQRHVNASTFNNAHGPIDGHTDFEPTETRAEPIVTKIFDASANESRARLSHQPHGVDELKSARLIGEARARDSDEISRLATFARQLARTDSADAVNSATSAAHNKLDVTNGGTNSYVNVNVDLFREQSANIAASCTVPTMRRQVGDPQTKNHSTTIYPGYAKTTDCDDLTLKDQFRRSAATIAASNTVSTSLKVVDIPLDVPHTVMPPTTPLVQDDDKEAAVLALALSLSDDENVNKNKVMINLSNFGNGNAFGFTIAGAGAGMSRADRPTVSVDGVGEASAAWRAGLRVGDFLVEVDGVPTAGKYFYSVRRLLNEAVTRAIVREDAAGGVLRLVVRRPLRHDIAQFSVTPTGPTVEPTDCRKGLELTSEIGPPVGKPFNLSNISALPPYTLSFNYSIASNNSSGLGSSISPSLSQKSDESPPPPALTAVATRRQPRRASSLGSSSGSEDYRVVALDSPNTPGRLDDFVPEVERSGKRGGTLNALRASCDDAGAASRVGDDTSAEPRLIRNYDLHLPSADEAAPETTRVETNPRQWRQFVAQQRTPALSDTVSSNRINADAKMQIIHNTVDMNNNEQSQRPVIKSLSRPNGYNSKSYPKTANGSAPPPIMTVSGSNCCAQCDAPLGRGAAMIVEALNLFYHLSCFRCNVCNIALGNGTRGADVQVHGHRLYCQKCFCND